MENMYDSLTCGTEGEGLIFKHKILLFEYMPPMHRGGRGWQLIHVLFIELYIYIAFDFCVVIGQLHADKCKYNVICR